MTDLILAALGLAALALIVVIVVLLRGRGGGQAIAEVARAQAELAGRLGQLSEQSVATQAAMEGALAERLAELTRRLDERLDRSAMDSAQTMGDLRERLSIIHGAQETIQRLSGQVTELQGILSNKQARGAFGEVQLEALVESALPPSAYAFQHSFASGRRVDCLIRLPNPPGPIGVDAKFPLEGYRALVAADGAARDAAIRSFGAAVLSHARDVADRYIIEGETAEGAVMFLPSEAVYAELHARCPQIVDQANRMRVYIVSPTTLWAVLHTMRAILKDVEMKQQAGLIQIEVGRLLDDVRRLNDRIEKLGRHFDQAANDVRQAQISTQGILRRGEAIRDVRLEGQTPAG